MKSTIRLANTAEDRHRIFEFRYRVYVEEMARKQLYADHERRTIEEPFDKTAHLLMAEVDGQIIGTLRLNFARETDLKYYPELFKMHRLGRAFPNEVALTTKLMVLKAFRSRTLAVRLAMAAYDHGHEFGMRYDIIDCNAHLEDFFVRLGYRKYCSRVTHPEYGEVLPLCLDSLDYAYLREIQSPFLRCESFGTVHPSSDEFLWNGPIFNQSKLQKIDTMNHTQSNDTPKFSRESETLMERMDQRMAEVLASVENTEFWKSMTASTLDPALAQTVMREVYLEIFSYQRHAIEGAIMAIARMPRSMPVRIIKAMLRHQAEEFDHGEMALRDHVALGGSESYARNVHRISPAANAVASIWRMIGSENDPFTYLGALYPFEGLTPIVSSKIKEALVRRGFPEKALEFVTFHSEEDPKHTELVKHLIQEVATRYPDAVSSIEDGLEQFLAIYPIPVWSTAFQRALNKISDSRRVTLAA